MNSTEIRGRYKVIHQFLIETTRLSFDQEPPYERLRQILS